MMKARLNPFAAGPAIMKAMLTFSEAVSASALEHSLMELVKMRASQINGCAFCIDMHARRRAARPGSDRSGSTCSTPGVNRRSTATASAQPSPGPRG